MGLGLGLALGLEAGSGLEAGLGLEAGFGFGFGCMKVPMLALLIAIAAQPASGHTTCLEARARLAPRNL